MACTIFASTNKYRGQQKEETEIKEELFKIAFIVVSKKKIKVKK